MQKMDGQQRPPPPGFVPDYAPSAGYVPPPGYMPPPPYSAQQPTVNPTIVVVQNTCFGPDPQGMHCPYCSADIVTRVESGPTAMTHLAFLMCFIFICWPCAPFVYCTDSCLARKHYCPNCNKFLGQNGC